MTDLQYKYSTVYDYGELSNNSKNINSVNQQLDHVSHEAEYDFPYIPTTIHTKHSYHHNNHTMHQSTDGNHIYDVVDDVMDGVLHVQRKQKTKNRQKYTKSPPVQSRGNRKVADNDSDRVDVGVDVCTGRVSM